VPSDIAMTEQHEPAEEKEMTQERGANGASQARLRKAAACVNHLCLESIIDAQVEQLVELQRAMCERIGVVIAKLANGHNRRSE
jgi:hypothetical protein